MKKHEYAIEDGCRLQVVATCAFASFVAAAYFKDHLGAFLPVPTAFAVLTLLYTLIWGKFLWSLPLVSRIHGVPVFQRTYKCKSVSNTSLPPRDCTISVYQTWTHLLIQYRTDLMEGWSVVAAAFPDSQKLVAVFESRPLTVPNASYLEKNKITREDTTKFAVAHRSVMTFVFVDGKLHEVDWYTDLESNHLGKFTDMHAS